MKQFCSDRSFFACGKVFLIGQERIFDGYAKKILRTCSVIPERALRERSDGA